MRLLRKGWMLGWGRRPVRVVVDDLGFVFWPGCGGWVRYLPETATIRLLPCPPTTWRGWYEWWTPNAWRNAAWACIYSA